MAVYWAKINTTAQNIKVLLDPSTKVDLEVNEEIEKFMFRHQNAEQNRNIWAANISLENVTKFKHFHTMLTNQNCIHEEIKSRLNTG
jgi:hypothetical protein